MRCSFPSIPQSDSGSYQKITTALEDGIYGQIKPCGNMVVRKARQVLEAEVYLLRINQGTCGHSPLVQLFSRGYLADPYFHERKSCLYTISKRTGGGKWLL